MSKKEKVTEHKEQKTMTKYDLKMQRRKEAKEQEKKEKRIETLIGVVIVVALVCLIASFPIRTYMAVNETFIKVDGEDISRVEFDYNYNVVKNNYLNQYGSYLSMFGLDLTADLSTQMYTETLTWEDYFEQQAVDSIIRGKALMAEAAAANFTYDVSEDYKEYEGEIKEAASESGLSVGDYVKQAYGSYATLGRVKEYIEESLFTSAYYTQLGEQKAPSDEEIQAHYEADTVSFDSVDYYVTLVQAELPTEPTELADTVEATTEESAETTTDTTQTIEEEYQPSDAEIEKAMADAKELADAAVAKVTTEGELQENMRYSNISNIIRDWLYDDSRKEGDTTVAEDTTNNQYYVVSFVKRYLDETPSANVRMIVTTDQDGEAILEEWKSGEATEESFGALADKYNEGTSYTAEGGYYEGIYPSNMDEEGAIWLSDASRVAGDTTAITTAETGTTYVFYYVGANDAQWKMEAKAEILSVTMEEYLQEISKDIMVEDPEGNLEYLAVQADEEAAAETTTVETTTAETATTEAATAEIATAETATEETTTAETATTETTTTETAQ